MKQSHFTIQIYLFQKLVWDVCVLTSLETADAVKEWIDTALAHDINFFDHADIYAKGQCEELFGKA